MSSNHQIMRELFCSFHPIVIYYFKLYEWFKR